ncbi:MAG: hypothetical protein M5U28_56590 [Sandaracinaceae bacterium]|nr:hypothetical protein [Sandaracinaceae bacterium]
MRSTSAIPRRWAIFMFVSAIRSKSGARFGWATNEAVSHGST